MARRLPLPIQIQPDDRSCGPTCLQAVYRFFEDEIGLPSLVDEIPQLHTGGTLAVQLACHALRRGYECDIYTYNVQVFDPTWFTRKTVNIAERLSLQLEVKGDDGRLAAATQAYLEYLELGGRLRWEVLGSGLIHRYLARGLPILTGLSATYLYELPREHGPLDTPDDVRGLPTGHFVVLCGDDLEQGTVDIADPWPHPSGRQTHTMPLPRVMCSILLGVLTYDANLLIISPRRGDEDREDRHEHDRGGQ